MNRKMMFGSVSLMMMSALLAFREPAQTKFDLKASIARGQEVYLAACAQCHQAEGQGVENVFPPVAKSDYLMADVKRSIKQVIEGATGEMVVNGKTYNGTMPAAELTDEQVSDVLNYVRNSFGNKGKAVKPEDVAALRKKD